MKTSSLFIRLFISLGLLMGLNACEHLALTDYTHIEPEVELEPPVPFGNTSVRLRANIIDRGISGVEIAGFCYNYDGIPNIELNQIASIINDSIQRFGTTVRDLRSGDTLYFFAFAGLEDSYYGISEPQEYIVP